jgi:hypothetical protein
MTSQTAPKFHRFDKNTRQKNAARHYFVALRDMLIVQCQFLLFSDGQSKRINQADPESRAL